MQAGDWSEYLDSVARPALDDASNVPSTPLVSAFQRWRQHIPAPCMSGSPQRETTDSPDVLVWRSLTDPTISIGDLIDHLTRETERNDADRGALLPQGLHRTIEVWTESELAALHGLTWLAMEHDRADWARLAEMTAAWHVDHLQPDNATNHPWSVHLFIQRALANNDPEASLYAETLILNCRVTTGIPDPLSAMILADAAAALRSMQERWP